MKSVGEAMAIGRSFPEALQKALRSLENAGRAVRTGAEPAGDRGGAAGRAARSRTTAGCCTMQQALRAGATVDQVAEATGIDPWFVDQICIQTGRTRSAAERRRPRRASWTPKLLRRGQAAGFSDAQLGQLAGAARGPGPRRCGTRSASGRCTRPWTPAPPSSPPARRTTTRPTTRRPRCRRGDAAQGDHPRQRAEPDRPGHRVRLLLRARLVRAAPTAGYETVMVNCNPETVLHRLRHLRPAVLRAAHPGGRARGGARRAAGRPGGRGDLQLGGQTPLGLAQRLKAAGVPIVGTQPEAIHLAEDRGEFGRVLAEAGLPAPRHGTAASFAEAQAVADGDRLPGAGPAVLRARRAGHGDRLRRGRRCAAYIEPGHRRSARSTRCWSTGSSTTRSRSTWTRCSTATELYLGGVMEHIEEAGIHSGDSACALPPITLGRRDIDRVRAVHRGDRPRGRRARAAQRAVRAGRRRALRAGGQPAGVAVRCRSCPRRPRCRWPRRPPGSCSARPSPSCGPRACCRPTGDGGDAAAGRAGRGQGGGAAVQPVPHADGSRGGHRARPGDALHRRGDGHRRGVRHGVRQVAGGRVRVAADHGPVFVSVANRDKRADDLPGQAAGRPRLRDPGHRGHRQVLRRNGVPVEVVRKHSDGRGPDGEPTIVRADPGRRGGPDRQHAVRQPGKSGPRLDGYEIRTAAVAAGIPCVTTVQGMAAAVQGIEALIRGRAGRALAAGACTRALREPAAATGGAVRQRRAVARRRHRCRSRRGAADAPGRRLPP